VKRLFRYLIIICTILLLTDTTFAAQNFGPRKKKAKELKEKKIVIESPMQRLPEHEKLYYTVRWLGIPVGMITASINGIRKINGRDAYELEVIAKANDFCSKIYRVEDRFVSYMDVEGLYTLRHEVNRREGRYKKDAVTNFDQERHVANFENFLDGSKKTFKIPEGVQDTLSASYYFRLLPIEVGKKIDYKVCNNESNYNLFGLVRTKKFVRLPRIGRKAAFHIQPYAKVITGSKVKRGRVSGYFSCDKYRIPLLAVVEAPVLTKVTVSLYKIETGQNE